MIRLRSLSNLVAKLGLKPGLSNSWSCCITFTEKYFKIPDARRIAEWFTY